MKVLINDLKTNILKLFSKNDEDSKIITEYLVWAEMTGNKTQGITKLSGSSPIQSIIPDYPVKIERDTKVSALLDGGKNAAIIVANKAVEIAAKKAKEMGISIVGTHNIFSSNGAQAYYVEKLAKQDLIGIMVSRNPGSTAPFNSIDPLFGTNPIGFAFPTNDDPIIFDAATSAITFYGLIVAEAHGDKLPDGIAMDHDGNFTNDPSVALNGAICTFGNSHKSAGLSMLVELLAGPLINGAYLDCKTFDKEWGSTIIAIDPNILTDINEFKSSCSDFVKQIKASRTKNDEKLYFPNDKARESYNECIKSGFVEVDDIIYNQIFNK